MPPWRNCCRTKRVYTRSKVRNSRGGIGLELDDPATRRGSTSVSDGSTHGYHAMTFGWLAGELVRRVDGRNIGRFIAEEIANPLGVEIYVGLPEHLEPRVSPLNTGWPRAAGEPAPTIDPKEREFRDRIMGPNTPGGKALSLNGAFSVAGGFNRRDVHAAEIPAANGISNARSVATMYAATMGDVQGARSGAIGVSGNDDQDEHNGDTPGRSRSVFGDTHVVWHGIHDP